MAGNVSVVISEVSSQTIPPTSRIKYEVRNDTSAPIWLVSDGWLIWHRVEAQIELSYARGRMRPGSQVFGYFVPTLTKIEATYSLSLSVDLVWPQPLDRLWNAEDYAAPPPGDYLVSVRIGYGLTLDIDAPGIGESVEAPVLRWQREAVSPAVPMTIPPYAKGLDV